MMTLHDTKRFNEFRRHLRGTGMFAFEKSGRFFLYREADTPGERNTLVLHSDTLDEFITRATKHAPHS